jgi:hypothetical protein
MTPIDVMRYARRLSVQVHAQDGTLRLRGKKTAIDTLAPLVRQHKHELMRQLKSAEHDNFNDHLEALPDETTRQCFQCLHLRMQREKHIDTPRIWFWRCGMGHSVREVGIRGQRVIVPPPDCNEWTLWVPGDGV